MIILRMRDGVKFGIGGVIVLLIAAWLLNYFLVLIVDVGDDGMAPTLLRGETVLAWKGVSEPEMGDILVCPNPRTPDRIVLGRVIGKVGMTIETAEGGGLLIAGSRSQRDYRGVLQFTDMRAQTHDLTVGYEKLGNTDFTFMERKKTPLKLRRTTVRKGVYLMGDYRVRHPWDSRTFGEVEPSTCLGTVFLRVQNAEGRDFEHEDLARGWLSIIE